MIILLETSRGNVLYKEIRNMHYVTNNGCIGRQIHYLIFDEEGFGRRPLGIISGASPVYACGPRDRFFKIDKSNRDSKLKQIVNNVVFRLEKHEKNLASKILSIWRKQITKDWYKKYKDTVIGFETFVYGENRTGAIYKADNWQYVGMSSGAAKKQHNYEYHIWETVPKKLIFCKHE